METESLLPLVWSARLALGLTFLVSGCSKLIDLRAFERGLDHFDLLPRRLVRPTAYLLPPIELTLGAAMLMGVALIPISLTAVGLLASFAVAVTVNLWRHRSIPCHCFGPSSDDLIGAATLLRILVLSCAAFVVSVHSVAAVEPAPGLRTTSPEVLVQLLSFSVAWLAAVVLPSPAQGLLRQVRTATRRAPRLLASELEQQQHWQTHQNHVASPRISHEGGRTSA